jgi:hypothetical protein
MPKLRLVGLVEYNNEASGHFTDFMPYGYGITFAGHHINNRG